MDWPQIVFLAVIALILGGVYLSWRYAPVINSDIDSKSQEQKPVWADDPVAQSIEWNGVNEWMPTQTCGALQIDLATNALIRFRPKPNPAPGLHLFIYVFSAVSAALIYFRLGAVLQAAVILAVGIAISCALLAASRRLGGEFTFDKDDGMFRSGGKSIGRISDIHALQLISAYWIRGREETTRISNNWELNLVMKDGERRNITSHDDFDLMFRDATTLSLFVSKPIWQRRR